MWTRPPGPPHVWRVYDLTDRSGKKLKISIQEIPEDRIDEALDMMCTLFIQEELISSSLDLINDPPAIAGLRQKWEVLASQGISVGAFKILEDNSKPVMVAVNILAYMDHETEKVLGSLKILPSKVDKIIKFWHEMTEDPKADPKKIYEVDGYLESWGLIVHPDYQKLGLGTKILAIRDDLGKKYNIECTMTLFTSSTSQKAADRAGFQTDKERLYDEAVDDDGSPSFPKLTGKSGKVMSKRIAPKTTKKL